MIIPKGCTAKNSFTLPFKEEEIEVLYITYQQSGKTVIEKTLADCSFADNKVLVKLSQEETILFDTNRIIRIQIRIRLKDGTVTKSNVITSTTDILLKTEVI